MDKKDKQIAELTKALNEMNAKYDQFTRLNRDMLKKLFGSKKEVESVDSIGAGLVVRANEILCRWVEWVDLTSEDYTAKYGESEDSMGALRDITKTYLDGAGKPWVAERNLILDMIRVLRLGIVRRKEGDKVVLTLTLDAESQDLIVQAIDKIDKVRKDM